MNGFKRIFSILLALDFIGLILMGISMVPTFKMMDEYGQIMMVVMSVMVALMVIIVLIEILAKIFIIRSTAPTFSWSSCRKRYITAAKLLLVLNLGAAILGLLSAGGEGATLLNQANLYLRLVANVVEMIAAFFYLRAVKRVYNGGIDK